MSRTAAPSERVLDRPDPVRAFEDAHERGVPVVLGTSGSAGPRRQVRRTTESWVASFPHVSALTGIDASARVWVPGPLTATMNLFAAVHTRWAGAAPAGSASAATHAHLTPAALHRLLDEGPAAPGLRVVVAGDRLPPGLAARAARAGIAVSHYYGAAELSFVAWGADAASLRPFPGVEVAVRDGQIWARSPYLCEGYDGPPGPLRRSADGFAGVGDRGRLEAGRLTVLGRPGSVTTAGGTVHLAEVEAALSPAATGEAVVVALPHDRLGALLAVALTEPSDHPPLRATARRVLDRAERPPLWFHVDVLPRTDAGKVDRAALAALLGDPPATVRRLT